jgi:hypothetical protein
MLLATEAPPIVSTARRLGTEGQDGAGAGMGAGRCSARPSRPRVAGIRPRAEPSGEGGAASHGGAAGVGTPNDFELGPFDAGFFVGLLVGEGHFGGDGRQAHITLRMHVDHEAVFRWLVARFPRSRLYGPYDHSGRRYFQWMARSTFLRETIVPLLDRYLRPDHSERVWRRYQAMKRLYGLGPTDDRRSGPDGPDHPG